MGGQQKDFISDIVFFQHQDGMRLKVRRHFLQCSYIGNWQQLGKVERWKINFNPHKNGPLGAPM
jgi:hypothetical protein